MIDEKDKIVEILFKKYNSIILSRKEVATTLGISTATLDRMRKNGIGPTYKKVDSVKNSAVQYSIYSIAEYIVSKNTLTSLHWNSISLAIKWTIFYVKPET